MQSRKEQPGQHTMGIYIVHNFGIGREIIRLFPLKFMVNRCKKIGPSVISVKRVYSLQHSTLRVRMRSVLSLRFFLELSCK